MCSLGSDFELEVLQLIPYSLKGALLVVVLLLLSPLLMLSTHEVRFCILVFSTFFIICICLNAPSLKI